MQRETPNRLSIREASDAADAADTMRETAIEWVKAGICSVTARQPAREVIESRYPYTYAWDFLRSHAAEFGLSDVDSRADASSAVRRLARDEHEYHRVAIILAEAYIKKHGLMMPKTFEEDA